MPRFADRDLTDQYISESYQSVLQVFTTGSSNYILDGTGSTVDNILLEITASQAVSASYVNLGTQASQSFSNESTWSFAHGLGYKHISFEVYDNNDDVIIPGRINAVDSTTADIYFSTSQSGTVVASIGGFSTANVISSSHANTASYVDYSNVASKPVIQTGIVGGTSFGGTPQTASITFNTAFTDNNYSVIVSGEEARTWTIQSKGNTSFEINSNSDTSFTGNVFWQAITTGSF